MWSLVDRNVVKRRMTLLSIQCLQTHETALLLEGCQTSPFYPSGNSNMWMKTSMHYDNDRGQTYIYIRIVHYFGGAFTVLLVESAFIVLLCRDLPEEGHAEAEACRSTS